MRCWSVRSHVLRCTPWAALGWFDGGDTGRAVVAHSHAIHTAASRSVFLVLTRHNHGPTGGGQLWLVEKALPAVLEPYLNRAWSHSELVGKRLALVERRQWVVLCERPRARMQQSGGVQRGRSIRRVVGATWAGEKQEEAWLCAHRSYASRRRAAAARSCSALTSAPWRRPGRRVPP